MYGNNKKDLIQGSKNFYWWEAIPPGRPNPSNSNVFQSIIYTAGYMDAVRSRLGNRAIRVTSWYRDSTTNANVGGATDSRHLYGDAVDCCCEHLTPKQMYEYLDAWHGSKGGLGLYSTHIHIDLRGYRARWGYYS